MVIGGSEREGGKATMGRFGGNSTIYSARLKKALFWRMAASLNCANLANLQRHGKMS